MLLLSWEKHTVTVPVASILPILQNSILILEPSLPYLPSTQNASEGLAVGKGRHARFVKDAF